MFIYWLLGALSSSLGGKGLAQNVRMGMLGAVITGLITLMLNEFICVFLPLPHRQL